jgi:hypothetical protein
MYSSRLRLLIRTARPTLAASTSPVEQICQSFVLPRFVASFACSTVIH